MHGVIEEFDGEIDFFELNWDNGSLDQLRNELDITGRSQYVLLDPNGEELRRWFGPLNATLADEVQAILTEAGY